MNWWLILWIGMWFPTLVGTFTIIMILKPEPKGSEVDTSNRMNFLTLYWFALTRRPLFTAVCPWLKKDQLENLKDVK